MYKLLRNAVVPKNLVKSTSLKTAVTQTAGAQEAALEELCILVDENDKSLGPGTKRQCHFVQKGLRLHRAFSVFIFNEYGDMLLQKRSREKVTFPNYYTNACCSHPLYSFEDERIEKDALGIRKAAQRRLRQELGISEDQVPLDSFKYLTRILYRDVGDGLWGEYEVDYILFLQKHLNLNPNPNEISELVYLPRKGVEDKLKSLKSPLTPWFKLILKNRLLTWWDNLDRLDQFKDHKTIHTFTH